MCLLGDSKSNEADNENEPAGDLLPAVSDQHYVPRAQEQNQKEPALRCPRDLSAATSNVSI